MNIAIASDHGGVELKKQIIKHFNALNLQDLGTNTSDSVDYPDYAKKMAKTILSGSANSDLRYGNRDFYRRESLFRYQSRHFI